MSQKDDWFTEKAGE